MKKQKTPPAWVVKPLVPEPVYTDREEFLAYFYQTALKAAARRNMSTVMLGQRRMGKTEIVKRVVNRLFFEQDPESPDAAVPVYFSFPDAPMDRTAFAKLYMENYIRFYVGFLAMEIIGRGALFRKVRQSCHRSPDRILGCRIGLAYGPALQNRGCSNNGACRGGTLRRQPVLYRGCCPGAQPK